MKQQTVKIELNRKDYSNFAALGFVQGNLDELTQFHNILHGDELLQIAAYKHERRRLSYSLGRISSKLAIGSLTGILDLNQVHVASGVFLFPVVKGVSVHNLQVSISHSNNVGISVAYPEEHPIGIDIEKIDGNRKETILSQVTESEVKILKSKQAFDINSITSIWSVKEAMSKVIRTGMMIDFKYLSISDCIQSDKMYEFRFSNFEQYKGYSLVYANYVVSIVIPARTTIDINRLYQYFNDCLDH